MAFKDIQKEVRLNFNVLNSLATSLSFALFVCLFVCLFCFPIPYCEVDSGHGFSFISLSCDFSLERATLTCPVQKAEVRRCLAIPLWKYNR